MFSEQTLLLAILTNIDRTVAESGQVLSKILRKNKADIRDDIKLMISEDRIGH